MEALTVDEALVANGAIARRLNSQAQMANKKSNRSRAAGRFARDEKAAREHDGRVRQLYRKLDSTKEWVENNYYHLPIEQQNGNLVKVNRRRFEGFRLQIRSLAREMTCSPRWYGQP